jgi:hypothetical protein
VLAGGHKRRWIEGSELRRVGSAGGRKTYTRELAGIRRTLNLQFYKVPFIPDRETEVHRLSRTGVDDLPCGHDIVLGEQQIADDSLCGDFPLCTGLERFDELLSAVLRNARKVSGVMIHKSYQPCGDAGDRWSSSHAIRIRSPVLHRPLNVIAAQPFFRRTARKGNEFTVTREPQTDDLTHAQARIQQLPCHDIVA